MLLSELLDELGITYYQHGEHKHATQNYLQVDCPWCSPNSERYRMGLHKYLLYASCWTCGSHKLYDTLREVLNDSTQVKALGSLLKGVDREQAPTLKKKGKLVLPAGLGPLKGVHRDYLRNRGIDPEQAERLWGVQGIGMAAELRWRIWIPIHYRGEVVSWTTRGVSGTSTSGNGAKYITATPTQEAIPSKELISGGDVARNAVIIVEGPMDRLRIGPGAVDTAGAAYSQAQVLMLSRFPIRYIAYDMDETGRKRAESLCHSLAGFPGKTAILELDAKDPGECSEKELKQLRRLLK